MSAVTVVQQDPFMLFYELDESKKKIAPHVRNLLHTILQDYVKPLYHCSTYHAWDHQLTSLMSFMHTYIYIYLSAATIWKFPCQIFYVMCTLKCSLANITKNGCLELKNLKMVCLL